MKLIKLIILVLLPFLGISQVTIQKLPIKIGVKTYITPQYKNGVYYFDLKETILPVSDATKKALDTKADKTSVDALSKTLSGLVATTNSQNGITKSFIGNTQDHIGLLEDKIANLQNLIIDLSAKLNNKEDKIPFTWFGNSFIGNSKDSLNPLQAVPIQVTEQQRLLIKATPPMIVYQTDKNKGYYLLYDDGWRPLDIFTESPSNILFK